MPQTAATTFEDALVKLGIESHHQLDVTDARALFEAGRAAGIEGTAIWQEKMAKTITNHAIRNPWFSGAALRERKVHQQSAEQIRADNWRLLKSKPEPGIPGSISE